MAKRPALGKGMGALLSAAAPDSKGRFFLCAIEELKPHSNQPRKFFSDEKIVRDGLSGNPNTPLKLLKVLADDADKMVRMRLAENPNAPQEILNKLLTDTDPNVAKAAEVNMETQNEKKA